MFFMSPASVTAIIKNTLPVAVWSEAMAAFTVLFSILQCVGPVVTGAPSDLTNRLACGLGASAVILLLGAVLAVVQRQPRR